MDRLTRRVAGDYILIKGLKTFHYPKEKKSTPLNNAIVRLAAYEDTGLMPDEVALHGKWTGEEIWKFGEHDFHELYMTCSCCHIKRVRDNFCSNCGAKMDME